MQERARRREFPAFPYSPYEIQQELMEQIWQVLERGGVGLFESPTGTGKTLTLLCAVLHWLEDHRSREERGAARLDGDTGRDYEAKARASDDVPSWMHEQHVQSVAEQERAHNEQRKQRAEQLRARAEAMLREFRSHKRAGTFFHKQTRKSGTTPSESRDDETDSADLLLAEPAETLTEDDPLPRRRRKRGGMSAGYGSDSSEEEHRTADELLSDLGGVAADDHVQVIFCSRTHSQLSQFVSELRRTSFAKRVTVAPLASRAHLCIHDDVLALGSATRINDRCLELQQGSAASAAKAPRVQAGDPGGGAGPSGARQKRQGCPYFSRGDVAARAAARDTVLSRAMDVEELGDLGRASRACPYYAARDAAGLADVVAVPYAGVVSRKAREALGVRLQGSVVVLDEAHNAADAVAQAHCAEVTLSQAALGGLCLRQYLRRFQSRLSAGNRMQLTLLVRAAGGVASAIQRGVCKWAMETGKFAAAAGLEGVNFIRVARFVSESKVLFKVASYVERQAESAEETRAPNGGASGGPSQQDAPEMAPRDKAAATAALGALVEFLVALSTDSSDGRVLPLVGDAPGTGGQATAGLRFVLLNAASEFEEVLAQARAVIFASGTLSPFEALQKQLFPGIDQKRIAFHSCGHVVPEDHLVGLCVGVGPSGLKLDFRSKERDRPEMLAEAANLIANIGRVVPGGTIVFLPSFAFMEAARSHWQSTGLVDRIRSAAKGGLFWEPRGATEVEATLKSFGEAVERHSGAVLVSVIGGKLSEGINFSDHLGRCVIVLGIPYPNPRDPEILARMAYLDRTVEASRERQGEKEKEKEKERERDGRGEGGERDGDRKVDEGVGGRGGEEGMSFTGKDLYESLCMRALNQSIGRVIRHRGDYAAVVLADARYARAWEAWREGKDKGKGRVMGGVSAWMRPRFSVCEPFGRVVAVLGGFFRQLGRVGATEAAGGGAARAGT